MRTVTEKYRATKAGKLAEGEFVRQMRLAHPQFITQFNGYNDTVQILKNKGLLFEEEYKTVNISDDAVARGIRYELTSMDIDPSGKVSSEDLDKAKKKAVANVEKDPLHYYNLLSGESSKVDKHDKYQEVKKNNHKDTYNDMKKATLKEAKQTLEEGTRALVGYLAGDRLTTAYNHYDGYPSNLGKGLETFYNDDEKAKDIAMKGYITHLDAETGEVKSTHNDPPKKIKLPEDDEDMAREVAEQIDGMGADYGYIWDDRANRWVTIKNTGIRSMIDQIMDKIGDYAEVQEADLDETEEEYLEKRDKAIKKAMGKEVEEVDSSLDPYEDKKIIVKQVIDLLKTEKGADNEVIKDFIRTHYEDIINLRDDQAILDEFDEFVSVNYEQPSDFMQEGDIPFYNSSKKEFPYLADYPVQQAFKKAGVDMSKPVTITQVNIHGYDQEESSQEHDATKAASVLETKRKKGIAQALKDYGKEWDDLSQTSRGVMPDYSFDEAGYDETPDGHDFKLVIEYEEGDYVIVSQKSSVVSEKKGKDHDGDGDIDGDDYKAAKDKAIKKAMGKDEQLKEAVKNIITRTLTEETINEAATNDLAKIAEDYGDFEGLKPAIIALENIVTEIESFYDKTRSKIQKIYNDLGEVRNEEGLKVGAFIAPSIENAFKRDLRPITKQQFHGGLEMPKVKRISESDPVMRKPEVTQMQAPKETVFTPVNEKK